MRRVSEEDLAKAHRELEELAARCESEEKRSQAARDALRQEAELERYRSMEEERNKWEARESRLFTRLEAAEEELRVTAPGTEDNGQLQQQLGSLSRGLSSVRSLVSRLTQLRGQETVTGHQEGQEDLIQLPGHQFLQGSDGGLGETVGRVHGAHNHRSTSHAGVEDEGCGAHTRHLQSAEGDTVTSLGESAQSTWRETSSEQETWPRRQTRSSWTRVSNEGTVVGEGSGGSWAYPAHLDSCRDSSSGEQVPPNIRATPDTMARASPGANTQTTPSAERPRTVTFVGPAYQPTGSNPQGNLIAVS